MEKRLKDLIKKYDIKLYNIEESVDNISEQDAYNFLFGIIDDYLESNKKEFLKIKRN